MQWAAQQQVSKTQAQTRPWAKQLVVNLCDLCFCCCGHKWGGAVVFVEIQDISTNQKSKNDFDSYIKKKRKKSYIHSNRQCHANRNANLPQCLSQWHGQGKQARADSSLLILISLPQKKRNWKVPPHHLRKNPSRLFLERLRMVQNWYLNFRPLKKHMLKTILHSKIRRKNNR